MRYELKQLPYSYDALSPVISSDIMKLHHDIHHLAYVNCANLALDMLDKGRAGETINMKAVMRDLSFNLNGHLMHELFWEVMRSPKADNQPSEQFNKIIVDSFGSFENFKKEFGNAAKTVEGSGWAVLYTDLQGDLFVGQLEKHNLLGINGMKVILALDVWEHAYYLDYKNDRASYVDKWWDIVNWDKVEELSLKQ